MNVNKSMRFWLAVFAVTLLSACHSNDDDDAPIAPSFTQQVTTEANTSSDNVEAKDIDAVVIASSEDSEPVEVN